MDLVKEIHYTLTKIVAQIVLTRWHKNQEIDPTDRARLLLAQHLFRSDEIVYSNRFENGDQKGAKLIAR